MCKSLVLKFGVVLFSTSLFSCVVYGPKRERKSVLNYLNGEHYETSQNGVDQIVVPFVKRKAKSTILSGAVTVKSKVFAAPLRHISLHLKDSKGVILQDFSSGSDGRFSLAVPLKNGTYSISIFSKKYAGSVVIDVKSYVMNDIIIWVTEK